MAFSCTAAHCCKAIIIPFVGKVKQRIVAVERTVSTVVEEIVAGNRLVGCSQGLLAIAEGVARLVEQASIGFACQWEAFIVGFAKLLVDRLVAYLKV